MAAGEIFSPAVFFFFFGKDCKMKGFTRENHTIGLCGLTCGLCPMQMDGYCPGCGGGEGNQSCRIAKCSMEQGGFAYCFQCRKYPCEKYTDFDQWDYFVTHQSRKREMARLAELGEAALTAEVLEKKTLLQVLLATCNGGRRKTFFALAVNLLPFSVSREILRTVQQRADWGSLSVKERENLVVPMFKEAAQQREMVLQLRKKPK